MKPCYVPGCSVGYELGIHVALCPLRESVLLVMLVFRLLSQRVSCYVASIIACCAQVLFPRQGN